MVYLYVCIYCIKTQYIQKYYMYSAIYSPTERNFICILARCDEFGSPLYRSVVYRVNDYLADFQSITFVSLI